MNNESNEIEKILLSHPDLSFAKAEKRKNSSGIDEWVAYVSPKEILKSGIANLGKDKVKQWAKVYDISYSRTSEDIDPEFNTAIWTSNYTGAAIPKEEMKEWVASTVDRILELFPEEKKVRSILEIGCGTGLLLYSLLPYVSEYAGIDNSEEALDLIYKTCEGKNNSSKVKLFLADADDLSGLNLGKYDIIIINSVSQYFPSVDYLIKVVEGLETLVNEDGFIFLGDINSYPLQEAFHAETSLEKASPDISIEQLMEMISKQRKAKDRETYYDPRLFHLLKNSLKWINSVEVQLRKGIFHNEMNSFRYDVILKLDKNSKDSSNFKKHLKHDWVNDELSFSKIKEQLEIGDFELMEIDNIPNARTIRSSYLLELISSAEKNETAKTIKKLLDKKWNNNLGIEPNEFWNLENKNYKIEVDSDYEKCNGRMIVRIIKKNSGTINYHFENILISESSNHPAILDKKSVLIDEINSFVKEKLSPELIPKEIYLISKEMSLLVTI